MSQTAICSSVREWDSLRQLAMSLASIELPSRDTASARDCRLVLALTEALIDAHRAAQIDGDILLCSLVEAALLYAGRRLKAEATN